MLCVKSPCGHRVQLELVLFPSTGWAIYTCCQAIKRLSDIGLSGESWQRYHIRRQMRGWERMGGCCRTKAKMGFMLSFYPFASFFGFYHVYPVASGNYEQQGRKQRCLGKFCSQTGVLLWRRQIALPNKLLLHVDISACWLRLSDTFLLACLLTVWMLTSALWTRGPCGLIAHIRGLAVMLDQPQIEDLEAHLGCCLCRVTQQKGSTMEA